MTGCSRHRDVLRGSEHSHFLAGHTAAAVDETGTADHGRMSCQRSRRNMWVDMLVDRLTP